MVRKMECTMVTTAHDESMTLKAMVESECSRCIVLYQHSFDKIPECSNEDIEYVKIEGFHEDAVKEIDKVLKDLKNVKFYLANVHLDIYILYYLLRKKEDYPIWILDNNDFIRMS
jgi:hypothetical protein